MNVLLFVPPFFMCVTRAHGFLKAILHLILFVVLQLHLAIPFLITNAESFFARAFEFKRQFLFKYGSKLIM